VRERAGDADAEGETDILRQLEAVKDDDPVALLEAVVELDCVKDTDCEGDLVKDGDAECVRLERLERVVVFEAAEVRLIFADSVIVAVADCVADTAGERDALGVVDWATVVEVRAVREKVAKGDALCEILEVNVGVPLVEMVTVRLVVMVAQAELVDDDEIVDSVDAEEHGETEFEVLADFVEDGDPVVVFDTDCDPE
jgi:hypothetical protein